MIHAPFRFDYVGSFLRPAQLKQAREDFEAGKITKDELTQVENSCITELVSKLKELGYHVITDGEFRRAWWNLDFFWGLGGIEKAQMKDGLHFHDEVTKAETAIVTGKIDGKDHPFIAKQTIPAPAQLLAQLRVREFKDHYRSIYPTDEELKDDIVKAYHQVILQLYEAGCRNMQFDDCTWTLYADRKMWPIFGINEEKLKKIAEEEIDLNNRALAIKPEDMVINTHVCRGNFHSTYSNEGPYDPIAPYLFARENVDAFYLEYDDARSGGFEPLRYVPEGKKVVLGLITSKRGELEDKERVIERIREASQFVPLENLCLSPQCGFASTEVGNKLTQQQQWMKLKLIKEIAEEVWN